MQNSDALLMNKQNFTQQLPEDTTQDEAIAENANDTPERDSHPSDRPPTSTSRLLIGLTPFWHSRSSTGKIGHERA